MNFPLVSIEERYSQLSPFPSLHYTPRFQTVAPFAGRLVVAQNNQGFKTLPTAIVLQIFEYMPVTSLLKMQVTCFFSSYLVDKELRKPERGLELMQFKYLMMLPHAFFEELDETHIINKYLCAVQKLNATQYIEPHSYPYLTSPIHLCEKHPLIYVDARFGLGAKVFVTSSHIFVYEKTRMAIFSVDRCYQNFTPGRCDTCVNGYIEDFKNPISDVRLIDNDVMVILENGEEFYFLTTKPVPAPNSQKIHAQILPDRRSYKVMFNRSSLKEFPSLVEIGTPIVLGKRHFLVWKSQVDSVTTVDGEIVSVNVIHDRIIVHFKQKNNTQVTISNMIWRTLENSLTVEKSKKVKFRPTDPLDPLPLPVPSSKVSPMVPKAKEPQPYSCSSSELNASHSSSWRPFK